MSATLTLANWLIVMISAIPLTILVVELVAGILPERRAAKGTHPEKVATILMPAHNEESGITKTLEELDKVMPAGCRVLVVADNCEDNTAEAARAAGAAVIVRTDPSARGKGHALAFGRDHLANETPPDVVIVLDADCRMLPGSIEALIREAINRKGPVQAVNLISADLAAGPMVQISSFAMVVKNLFRSRGMQRLGGAALLTGTGMAFAWPLFAEAKLATGSIVEDLTLGIALTRQGQAPRLVAEAHVRSAPADMRDALQQRQRWEHGFLGVLRHQALPALFSGLRQASLAQTLLGLHLLVPPLALLLLLSLVALALSGALAVLGASAVPTFALMALLATACVLIVLAWLAEGREFLTARALLSVPFYALWKLPIYAGFLKRPEANWTRTPRR